MSKFFIIPDVHLKPWMFENADSYVTEGDYDGVILLGDLVDDWNQQRNLDLYNETFDAAIHFVEKHPNTLWCIGNHDISYVWGMMESGYSYTAEELVRRRFDELMESLPPENSGFIHKIDHVLFSHAGLTQSFVLTHFGYGDSDLDYIVARINQMEEAELWTDNSPIWARPQDGEMRIYPKDIMQVVGHTPVSAPLEEENLLTLDTFSTYPNGNPIGDERFVWVDTVEKTWAYVE